jgi:glycosyltransferase involved in cell wall biosynthesis
MLALLRARQFEAEVVCPSGGALEQELQQLGIKVCPLEFGKFSVRQNPLWHFGFYRRFRRTLKASQSDAIVVNLDGNTPLVTLAAVRAGIPIVRFSRFEFQPPTRWLDRWCWLQTQAIICPSELVKQQVLAWAPSSFQGRVHRFYDAYTGRAATLAEITAFRREFNFGNDKLIGCIGRLHPSKRVEIAIEALAEVRKQVDNVRLIIVGSHDGSPAGIAYHTELQQLASALGVREVVHFLGYRSPEAMPAAMAVLNVCVLPSESESFGMVLIEAWAEGVPTIASDVSGCGEITRASGGGHLAPVGDAKAFAGQLATLLANPEVAASFGQKGKTWVHQNCVPAEYAVRFASVINALPIRSRTNLSRS